MISHNFGKFSVWDSENEATLEHLIKYLILTLIKEFLILKCVLHPTHSEFFVFVDPSGKDDLQECFAKFSLHIWILNNVFVVLKVIESSH